MSIKLGQIQGIGFVADPNVSVITSDTGRELCRLAGTNPEIRRFPPSIVIPSTSALLFEDDEWVGGMLTFGDAEMTLPSRLECATLAA